MGELEVLLEQLEDLMGEGIVDEEDAIELAILAGLATRLGGTADVLERAVTWRKEAGRELLASAFAELDLEEIVGGIDGVLSGNAEVEAVEEALYELDDVVAAAVWAGQRKAVKAAAHAVAETIRQVPEPFAPLAEYGSEMARSPTIAADLDVYEYWLAVADAGAWKETG